ncbi:hypothetical protein BDF19DRAFT_431151 [Syncephalis fuscata]|nr:hypothetical protein BDF19DRAFT_431151 [Syncephalis fuscata]
MLPDNGRVLSEYDRVLQIFRKETQGSRPNRYDEFSRKHIAAAIPAHNNPKFLPWHRALVFEFERALQSVSPGMMAHYWEWSSDSQAPENSPVLRWLGGNGRQGDNCVLTGEFGSWRPYYPNGSPHCMSRKYNNGDRITPFSSPGQLNRLFAYTDYDQFRAEFEGVDHAQIHNNIAAEFSTMASPNDPLFWMHHSFVDKVWAQWQSRGNNRGKYAGGPAQLRETLAELPGHTVESVLDISNLCYTYSKFGSTGQLSRRDSNDEGLDTNTGTTRSKVRRNLLDIISMHTITLAEEISLVPVADRSELYKLRDIHPVSEKYIRMHHADVATIRRYEEKAREVTRKLNRTPGYVSSAALINHPELLEPLVSKQSTFTATHGKKQCVFEMPKGEKDQSMVDALISKAKLSLSIELR